MAGVLGVWTGIAVGTGVDLGTGIAVEGGIDLGACIDLGPGIVARILLVAPTRHERIPKWVWLEWGRPVQSIELCRTARISERNVSLLLAYRDFLLTELGAGSKNRW